METKKKRRSKITTKQIIEFFKEKHDNLYNYSLVYYKTMHTKVCIICNIHGEFWQSPKQHLDGHGCKKCAVEILKSKQKSNTESFIKKAISIHGNRYDYSKTNYGKNAHEKVKIICKEHGVFEMTPNSHLSKKSNCRFCANKSCGWSKSSWRNASKNKIAKLYIIRCWNKEGEFYKIGITVKTIEERFNHKYWMPYNWEVIKVIESINSDYIFDLERKLHKIYKKQKYLPKLFFDGFSECFNKIKL